MIETRFIGMCTHEDGGGSNADSPDSECGCPGLSELPRKRVIFLSCPSSVSTHLGEESGRRGMCERDSRHGMRWQQQTVGDMTGLGLGAKVPKGDARRVCK